MPLCFIFDDWQLIVQEVNSSHNPAPSKVVSPLLLAAFASLDLATTFISYGFGIYVPYVEH